MSGRVPNPVADPGGATHAALSIRYALRVTGGVHLQPNALYIAAMTALTFNESILLLSAFAAGTVDIISFALLGGVFASAMTGNLALLAYYVARGNVRSVTGSIVALAGFAAGCALGVLQRRGRAQYQALTVLMACEAGLLLCFALYSMWAPAAARTNEAYLQIVLLAVAMGLQSVVGQTTNLTTIVFTTTLTKMVGTLADSIAGGEASGLKEIKIQSAVVVSYLFGALLAGALIVHKIDDVVFLPFVGVALAFVVHCTSRR